MGSTGNQYFELIESVPMNTTTYNNNNNNNNNTTMNNNKQQFNSLFDIESNKENSVNQSNINNNNSNSNNNTSSLKLSTSKILQNNNNSNSFSIGLYKLPLSPRVSPRIVSSSSNGNSACNSEFSSPQPSSLLEDTLIAINNSDENPLKKHRNSQILSKNFYSLSLHNQDSPKHSRSTTDLSAFFNMSDPDEFMNSRSKTFCGGDLTSQFKFDHTFVTTTTTTNKPTENNNSNSNNCNSNSSEVIFNNNNSGVNSLKRSSDGSSAASAFANNNSGNTTAANSLKSSTCSVDGGRKSPVTVVHSHSSSSIPYRYSCSILKTPVLSSSAPSLLSMLDEADSTTTTANDTSSNTTVTTQDESFTLVSTPIKDQNNRSLVLSDDDEDNVNNVTGKQHIEEEESSENILIRHQHVNNHDDEDEEDDLPPTPIQIRTRYSPLSNGSSNGNVIRHSHSLFISKTASNLLSPPLTVSSRHSTSLSFLSTNVGQQYYPSSPELSPMIPTPHKNQSMVDDDSPNTSLDQIGGSPYKTPSKALSFLSPNSPNNNTNNNNNTTQTGKRSRTCLDFTKYSSHLFDEDTSSTSSHSNQQQTISPTNSPKNSNINLNNNICNVKNTTTTITQTTTNVTASNTLNAIQQNLNNNALKNNNTTSGPLSTSTPNIPPYLANHEIYQRSNSVSSSRPPRFLSMSTASFISKQSPDISTLPRPVPFDNSNNVNNQNNNNTNNNNFGNSNSTESNVDNNNQFNNPVVNRNILRIIEQQQQQQRFNNNLNTPPTQDQDQHDDQFSPKLLDIETGTRAGFNGVSSETVKKLLRDPNKLNASKVTIIDCRYQYEFQGGHIIEAINIPPTGSRQMVLDKFFKEPPKDQLHVIIFHCEFSSKRAPDCYNLFRELDREHNSYPNVYYPEIYLLNGGFKKFWETCVNLCTGDYIRMDDKLYQTHLKEEEEKKKKEKIVTRNIKAFKNRSHSFHV